jgi:hypothetical protein
MVFARDSITEYLRFDATDRLINVLPWHLTMACNNFLWLLGWERPAPSVDWRIDHSRAHVNAEFHNGPDPVKGGQRYLHHAVVDVKNFHQ